MTKLIPIYAICAILTFLSERISVKELDSYDGKIYIKKEAILYYVMAFAMAVFVGLRIKGNDTSSYMHMFDILEGSWTSIKSIDWLQPAKAPGFFLVNYLMKMARFSTQDFLMCYALFTVIVYFWFIRKFSNNIPFSVFLLLGMGCYTFTMAAIKQTTATAFMLIATDKAINKKYIPFAIFTLVAFLFHPYSIILAVSVFLDFTPWSKKTYIFLIVSAILAFNLQFFSDLITSVTASLGADYGEGSFSGEGVNIFRVLVVWVPSALSYLAREPLADDSDRQKNIIINMSMMNSLIMFVGLFGTANYFARLANYFLIFQVITLPILFNYFDTRSLRFLKTGSVVGYSLYQYYSNVLATGEFDSIYSFISVKEYIVQLFSR